MSGDSASLITRDACLAAVDPETDPLFSALNLVREEMRSYLERNSKVQYLVNSDYGVMMELVDGRLVFVFKESPAP